MASQANYQTYKEKLIPILLKFFQKIKEQGILPKTFYEATITLIINQTKITPEKKIDKLLARFTRKKGERTQTNKIETQKEKISTNTTEI